MNINSAFPSEYLKAADLQGREVPVRMERVEICKVGRDDNKPVVYFIGKQKGLVLNKTNAGEIANYYGDDTNRWHGQTIILYPTRTDYQGKSVPCVRVKCPPRQHPPLNHQAPLHQAPPPAAAPGNEQYAAPPTNERYDAPFDDAGVF